MMPVSPILLLLSVVLIQFGWLPGLLKRVGLTQRQALVLVLSMLLASLVEITITPRLTINLGTGVLPLLISLSLLTKVQRWWEPLVALLGAVAAGGALGLLSRWLPSGQPTELNLFYLDAQYFYALVAGSVSYLIGHTRAAAFGAGVLGVLLGDLYHYRLFLQAVPEGVFRLSGGGFHGTALVAGLLALVLADLLAITPTEPGRVGVDHLS